MVRYSILNSIVRTNWLMFDSQNNNYIIILFLFYYYLHLFLKIPLPPINDTHTPVVSLEPEAKLNPIQLSPVDEPLDIESSSPLLTNDSPPTIVTTPPLLNDNKPDSNTIILHHCLIIHLRSSSSIHQLRCLQNQL